MGAPFRGAGQRIPAAAHGGAGVEARRDARGDLPRIHDAPRAQGAAPRDRLRRDVRVSGTGGRPLRGAQGRRRARRAGRRRLRALATVRAEAPPPRAESRGAPDPVADRGDHGHRCPVRRLSLRAQGSGRPGDRPRAVVRIRRRRARPVAVDAVPRRTRRRIPGLVLGPDADGARLPRDPARRRALPHRHRRCPRSSFAAAHRRTGCRPSISKRPWATATRRT